MIGKSITAIIIAFHVVFYVVFYVKCSMGQILCPLLTSKYKALGNKIKDIEVSDHLIYLTYENDISTDNGLQIIDVVDEKYPVSLGYCKVYGLPDKITYASNQVYVVNEIYGLEIFDVLRKLPFLMGNYSAFIYDVAVFENIAYVTNFETGLLIIDVSDMKNPYLVNSFEIPGYDSMRKVVVGQVNNYLFVTDKFSGLFIISISDKVNPKYAFLYPTSDMIIGIAVSDWYVYILTKTEFQIVSIGPSTEPELLSSRGVSNGVGISVIENYVFVVTSWEGLKIFNTDNKRNPIFVGSYEISLPNSIRSMAAFKSFIYLADRLGYLQIINWNISCLQSSRSQSSDSPKSTTLISEGASGGNFFLKV